MPMYAVLDAIVNLDKFRNVDLVQQGFYRISVRLQGLRSGTPAVPLATYPSDRSGTLGCDDMGEGAAEGMQSFLDSRENAYVTRPFYVRYNDHTACLCEMAHFRLELDCSVSVRELEDVLVRFDLQFAVRPKSEGGASAAAAAAAGPGRPPRRTTASSARTTSSCAARCGSAPTSPCHSPSRSTPSRARR